jgi:RNA polymerase sigma-70 factor (ECF subfamily)
MPAVHGQEHASDADLVRAYVAGTAGALAALTARYYRPVGAFILRRTGQPGLVEDLVQETFLEACRALRGGTIPQHFSSWLFGIAFNRVGKFLRRKRLALFSPDDPPVDLAGPSELDARQELEEQQKLLACLDASLADLPEEVRQILELKHRHGLTCEQIAERTGRPTGTIKSLLSRTYRTLRERLRPQGDTP